MPSLNFTSKSQKNKNSFSSFELVPFGASLKFDEKIMNSNDDYVQKNSLRKVIAKSLSKEIGIQKIIWRESRGIAEIEPMLNATLPIDLPFGLGLSLDFGFQTRELLVYRYSRPTPVYYLPDTNAKLKDESIISLTLLKKPSRCRWVDEIEITGAGKIKASAGLSISEGVGIEAAKAGISLSLGASQAMSEEFSLSVLALDRNAHVRVRINESNKIVVI